MDEKTDIEEYINSLNEKEKIALEIAKSHLESSFSMESSIGYLKWKNNKKLFNG
jgi:hypothetical protein